MKYLSQSTCKKLAEELFGTTCRLHTNKGRNCIYLESPYKDQTWNLIGYGIGWHAALMDAKTNAEIVIKQAQANALKDNPVSNTVGTNPAIDSARP